MYRATTPKHIFHFNVDPNELFKEILITYNQNGSTILEKHKSDLTFEPEKDECDHYVAWLRLTQEETKLFSAEPRAVCTVQLRVVTYAGEVAAGPIETVSVQSVLNDEVLS